MAMRIFRNSAMGVTIALWFLLCWAYWQQLIRNAVDSPEIYTRGAGFQLFNFLAQYFWFFAVVLAIVLVLEWLVFRLASRIRGSD